ncbi:MAG: hypothetical protein WA463_19850 [Terriglobales bacterium]
MATQPTGAQHANGDLAVVDQLRNVRQRQGGDWTIPDRFVFYAAGCSWGGTLAARFHGSNSWMRRIGWSAMRVNTWRR